MGEREREKESERRESATGVRFITLIAAVTKLPPDLHTIAFEIRRPQHCRRRHRRRRRPHRRRRAALCSQKYSAEKRMSSFNSPRHGSANLRAAAFSILLSTASLSCHRRRGMCRDIVRAKKSRIENKIMSAIDRPGDVPI